ncbi:MULTISPECIES: hypothetical protein [Pseudomonas]|uniref:Uncharacterized protein n=1 Tax=Pseudomonas azadiae TaxID=2843612 RepID=A0ABS6NTF4_9PSED|nr:MULTISPECIES: hypothetical protein [Pseudomonas]MBV4451494.1 hypothetical protein [Pseudomonas azadiae]NMF40098.1 hypothetical protein [Pseudomonas sp. SWRI 103]
MGFFLVYTIVWFVWLFVSLGVMIFAEYKKLDEVESYFSENERVRDNKRFWSRNQWIDRQYRMLLLSEFFSDSKHYLKAGVVTEAELASVPLALKRWMVWPYYIGYVWVLETAVWALWRWWCDIPIP